MRLEQEPMMLPDTAGENLHPLSPRAAETLVAKRGELFGIRLSGDQGLQHAASASAHDVRDLCTSRPAHRLCNVFIATSSGAAGVKPLLIEFYLPCSRICTPNLGSRIH